MLNRLLSKNIEEPWSFIHKRMFCNKEQFIHKPAKRIFRNSIYQTQADKV